MFDDPQNLLSFTRWYLAGFFSAVAMFYTFRIVYLKRTSSKQIIFPGNRFCSTWWNHMAFRIFRAGIWFICLIRAFWPNTDSILMPLIFLQQNLIITSGLVFLTVGFLATISIHLTFCADWRSGIDPRGPASITTKGIYQYSRNPMFLGVAMSQLGFFLALPSVFTLVCLCVGLTAIFRQTLSEEAHLAFTFPESYSLYCTQVRRWI